MKDNDKPKPIEFKSKIHRRRIMRINDSEHPYKVCKKKIKGIFSCWEVEILASTLEDAIEKAKLYIEQENKIIIVEEGWVSEDDIMVERL